MSNSIPQEVIEEIRSRTNIVDVVGQYVQLKKSGKNYLGLCPFHDERSPSFSVAEDKQFFHCFGCGKSGNVFQFVQDAEGISFPEAVEKVADVSHIPLADEYKGANSDEKFAKKNPLAAQLIELHEKAAELYHHVLLNTKAGEEALKYLEQRGLSKEIISTFKIGFAPKQRILLQQVFQQEKVSDELLGKSGLMVQYDSGDWVDRFYQRIMFPIFNQQGKIIAFSGRILETSDFDTSQQPKYLNSPETDIFNKRLTLFNFDKARATIRKENQVVLFEGFMDVIAAWRAGVKNGVASMGTSLTNEQINALRRVTNQVVICYDGDSAGIEATERGIKLLSETSTMDISIISLPEKLDPDEYIKKYGEDAFKEVVQHGQETVFAFKMHYLKQKRNLQNEKEKLAYIDDVLSELVNVPSVVERELYLNQISQEYGVSIESLTERFETFKGQQKRQQPPRNNNPFPEEDYFPDYAPPQNVEFVQPVVKQVRKLTQVEKAERLLLYRMMTENHVLLKLQNNETFTFAHDVYQQIYTLLNALVQSTGNFDIASFLEFIKDEQIRNEVAEIFYMNISEESSQIEIDDCLRVIEKSSLEEQLRRMQQEQREAGRKGDKALEIKLAMQIVDTMKQLKNK